MAVSVCGDHTPRTVEIGPGRGALTRFLLPRTDELHAIELDPVLAARLKTEFASDNKLQLHQADVLSTDLAQWGPAVLAGNLPYYITSPIIERFLDLDKRFPTAVFLMQWEVAQRLLASPGTREYGYLSVSTQMICDVELICQVPPGAFSPPPKVDSAGVRLVRKAAVPLHRPELLKFVGRAFAMKRKMLRNNLRPFYGDAIAAMPEARLRAEELTIAQFQDLFARLEAYKSRAPVH